MIANIMRRAVRWECGCVGLSFGWHNGVYEHVLLEACDTDGDEDELLFVSRLSLAEKRREPLDQIEIERLSSKLSCVFRDASLLRTLRGAIAEALDKSN